MIDRRAQPKLRKLLQQFPAVALLGPRQVGKTTLAHSLAEELGTQALYLDLELPSDRAKLTEPELYLAQHAERLVIFDEIHRLPGIFATLRGLIDQRRREGKRNSQFLMLGSASIDLLQQSAETLAGRIAYEELTPFSLAEVAASGIGTADQLWNRGGFWKRPTLLGKSLSSTARTTIRRARRFTATGRSGTKAPTALPVRPPQISVLP